MEMNIPPLPQINQTDTTMIVLPAWSEFQRPPSSGRYDTYLGMKRTDPKYKPPTGEDVLLMFGEGRDDDSPLTAEQIKAYSQLHSEQVTIRDSIVQAIFAEYPHYLQFWRDGYAEKYWHLLPEITMLDELKPLMQLRIVHIQEDVEDGVAYVGYLFECKWEEEHSLGVMTHNGRIIEIGHGDVAHTL